MEKDNYEVGQNNRAPKVPRHGPGRGMRPGEKQRTSKVHGQSSLRTVRNTGVP